VQRLRISAPEAITQAAEQIVGEEFSQYLDPTYEPEAEPDISFQDAEYFLTRFKPSGRSN
jgi:hypothetical protein